MNSDFAFFELQRFWWKLKVYWIKDAKSKGIIWKEILINEQGDVDLLWKRNWEIYDRTLRTDEKTVQMFDKNGGGSKIALKYLT